MNEELKYHVKRYVKTFIQGFLSGVCLVSIPMLDSINLHDVTVSLLVGVIFAGLTSGIKFVMEVYTKEFEKYQGYVEYLGSIKKKKNTGI